MRRHKLRRLLVLLSIGPPMVTLSWQRYTAWKMEQERQRATGELVESLHFPYPLTDLKNVWL